MSHPPQARFTDHPSVAWQQLRQAVQQCETQWVAREAQDAELREEIQHAEQDRERYAGLFDGAPIPYMSLDEEGYIQEINHCGASLLGATSDEITGYPFSEYVVAKDKPAFFEHIRRCVFERVDVISELTIRTRDGRLVPVQLRSTPAEDADQECFCRTAVVDITEQKRIEGELRQSRAFLQTALDVMFAPLAWSLPDDRLVVSLRLALERPDKHSIDVDGAARRIPWSSRRISHEPAST